MKGIIVYVVVGGMALAAVLYLVVYAGMDHAPTVQDEEILILGSFFPYYEFARNVAGSQARVEQYIPFEVEAHDWEPRAGEIQRLKDADIFVYNGLGPEPYVTAMMDSGEFDHVVFLRATEGIGLVIRPDSPPGHVEQLQDEIIIMIEQMRGQATDRQIVESIGLLLDMHKDDGHDHDGWIRHIEELIAQKMDDGQISDAELTRILRFLSSGGAVTFDPHMWLDPILAMRQVDNIRDGLVMADPDGAQHYMENAAIYNEKLGSLDAKIRSGLLECQKDTFISFHNAFAYFAKRYGLTAFSIGGISPESEASAFEIASFVDYVRDNDIKFVFSEDLVDPRLAQVIADEAGAQVVLFSPIETLTAQEASDGVTFLDKMEQNLDILRTALECQ